MGLRQRGARGASTKKLRADISSTGPSALLLAVTTLLLEAMAVSITCRAMVAPSTNSTTLCTSGCVTRSLPVLGFEQRLAHRRRGPGVHQNIAQRAHELARQPSWDLSAFDYRSGLSVL